MPHCIECMLDMDVIRLPCSPLLPVRAQLPASACWLDGQTAKVNPQQLMTCMHHRNWNAITTKLGGGDRAAYSIGALFSRIAAGFATDADIVRVGHGLSVLDAGCGCGVMATDATWRWVNCLVCHTLQQQHVIICIQESCLDSSTAAEASSSWQMPPHTATCTLNGARHCPPAEEGMRGCRCRMCTGNRACRRSGGCRRRGKAYRPTWPG